MLALVTLLAGCGADPLTTRPGGQDPGQAGTEGAIPSADPSAPGEGEPSSPTPPRPAREGTQAASQRIRFAPELVVLPDGTQTPVDPAGTEAGVLDVPVSVDRAGWWDGSSYVGDPFGSTVVAGHVDSREQGLGAFSRLLDIETGAQVDVRGGGYSATYRVTSVTEIDKDALATGSEAFEQTGPHRLVLITCTGEFDPERRSYDSNLVVVAEPVT